MSSFCAFYSAFFSHTLKRTWKIFPPIIFLTVPPCIFWQMHLPLNSSRFSLEEQNTQDGSYFFKMMRSSSVIISNESLIWISMTLLNSIGRTIRPNSSTFLTIPGRFQLLTLLFICKICRFLINIPDLLNAVNREDSHFLENLHEKS